MPEGSAGATSLHSRSTLVWVRALFQVPSNNTIRRRGMRSSPFTALSSPFKEEVGRGMVVAARHRAIHEILSTPSPPNPPLEGDGLFSIGGSRRCAANLPCRIYNDDG